MSSENTAFITGLMTGGMLVFAVMGLLFAFPQESDSAKNLATEIQATFPDQKLHVSKSLGCDDGTCTLIGDDNDLITVRVSGHCTVTIARESTSGE
jgi:hypothetical protein